MPIKIGAKALAQFMLASPSEQRRILRDYKFPKPEGAAKGAYYADAINAIRDFHASGNDEQVLADAMERLRASETTSGKAATVSRLRQNRIALAAYLRNFSNWQLAILQTPPLALTQGVVRIKARADLCVMNGTRKLVKIDCGKPTPEGKLIKVVLQVMFQAASANAQQVRPQDIVYVDVRRASRYKGARVRSRINRDIEAACANIEALWPSIRQ